jgi:hypothetical protein
MALKIGKAKIGAGTVIGGLVGGPAGAAVGAAYDNKEGAKQIGKDIGKYNPYAKTQTNIPQASSDALKEIAAPKAFDEQGFTTKALDTAPQNQWRQGQQQVAAQLMAQAQGTAPSIAAMQMQQGQAAALAASRAALASQRGGANPLAARAALMGNQQSQLQLAERAGIARLAEQQQAAQNYGSIAGQARGQDMTLAQQQADQQNQFNNLRQQYLNQGLSVAQANQQAALEFERMRLGQASEQARANAAATAAQKQMVGGLINNLGQAGMAYATGGASLAAPAAAGAAAPKPS